MKKIISILLVAVLVFSAMPITALAEDVQIESQEVFSNDLDYNAYDAIVQMVDELDSEPYTEESFNALLNSIADRDSFVAQEDVDAAVRAIGTAYSNLVLKSFEVNFVVIDSNENIKRTRQNYSYGEVAELNVGDTNEVASKWILSTDDEDIKLNATGNSYSMVVTQGVTITATTAVSASTDEVKKVKFLAYNSKVVDIVYTYDVSNIEMPNAPKIPFYTFSEWQKLDDETYQATYTLNALCDGVHHTFYLETIKPGCETVGYLIFSCECGETYATEYVRQTGHSYDDNEEYCLNGCGKHNPNFEDENESSTPEEKPTTPADPQEPTKPSDERIDVGIDEGGYSNLVITP